MDPLNPEREDREVSGSEEEEPSEHETSGEESDDTESLFSIPVQLATHHKPLKVGQRKGEKKAVEVFDIYWVSERMARDLTWGQVQANDGRRAYIPEAGQRDYHIPDVWADRLEDKVELRVKVTVGEWANILMIPSYHTLETYQPLTSKFRTAYVGVVHDVMLRRLKKAAYKDRGASQVMMTRPRVTLENAYWRGDEIYTKVEGEPYLVDTGAEESMTRRGLKTTRYLTVQFANGTIEEMPYGTWQGIIWVKGPYNLITVTDLKELNKPWGECCSLSQRLSQLRSRLVKIGSTQSGTGAQEWYTAVNVPEVTEQKLKESDFFPAGKEKLRKIITSANVARFKNDCGDLGPKYVHLIEGEVQPHVRQYPLNPGAVEEMDKIVKELSALEGGRVHRNL
ncbi:hypothetical protein XENOCAPTIV_017662 [Xenoophorus captivus]|uniref:Uncharacterized protein n=1 Tax=Xenoophorus captivus TaxID=1517983 RepID=A0ABV0RZ98_9TELE